MADQIHEIAGLEGTQEWIDELNNAGFNPQGAGNLEIQDPWVLSQLGANDPKYMKRPGGETKIGGKAANFINTALPYAFEFEVLVDEDPTREYKQTSYEQIYKKKGDEVANLDVNQIEVRELYRASPLGKEFDRYFKWINQTVLEGYGARPDLDAEGNLQYTKEGEVLYQWNDKSLIKTMDKNPLTTLDGEVITSAGHYDFTRRGGSGDGGELIYDDTGEYITGVKVYLTDNMFGDNNWNEDVVRDPGAASEILPELGGSTTAGRAGSRRVIRLKGVNDASIFGVGAGGGEKNGIKFPPSNAIPGNASFVVTGEQTQAGFIALNLDSQQATAQGSGSSSGGSGEAEASGGGDVITAQGQNQQGLKEGRDDGDQEGRNTAEMGVNQEPEEVRRRRDLLLPRPMEAAQADEADPADSFILKRLQDKTMLGNHLLDALALGVGIVYGFYGPDMAKLGQSRWQKLSRKFSDLTGLGQGKAAAERRLLCLYVQEINGSQRIMASRLAGGGVQGLAQVELPAGVRVEQAGSQAQVDYAMQQLIAKLNGDDLQAVRSLWVAPELQAQAKLIGTSSQATHLMQLPTWSRELDALEEADNQELRRWVMNPNSELKSEAVKTLISKRQGELQGLMEQSQAQVAALFELGLAMSQRQQEEQS